MRTKILFLSAVLFCTTLLFTSCLSKEDRVINRLDKLAERVENKGDIFDADDWEDALEEFSEIHEEIQYCDFTREQLRELGKKEGKLYMIFAKQGAKAFNKEFKNFMDGFGSFTNGLIDGAKSEYDEDEFEEISNDFEDTMEQFAEDVEGFEDIFD